jgi:hypothetical protein
MRTTFLSYRKRELTFWSQVSDAETPRSRAKVSH